MSKYNNKKTIVDNIKFDSKVEANRYIELKMLEKARKISDLELQPKFILQEQYINNKGEKIRAITYKADFCYLEGNKIVVEDVKGVETKEFKINRNYRWIVNRNWTYYRSIYAKLDIWNNSNWISINNIW